MPNILYKGLIGKEDIYWDDTGQGTFTRRGSLGTTTITKIMDPRKAIRTVEYYGAKDDNGVTDNTTAFQTALNAGGEIRVTAPNGGYYKITDTLTVSTAGTKIISRSKAKIRQTTVNKGVFEVTASGVEIDGIEYQGPWVLGSAAQTSARAIYAHGADTSNRLTSFTVKNCTGHGFGYTLIDTAYVDHFTAHNNYLHTAAYLGIKSWFGDYQVITKNRVEYIQKAAWGDLAVGIAIGANSTLADIPKFALIDDNYVAFCGYEGILFEPAWYSKITNNMVVDCYLGIVDGQWNDGASVYGRGLGNTVSKNTVVNLTLTGADVRSGILGGGPNATYPATGSVYSGNVIINYGTYDTVHYGALDIRYYQGASITGNDLYSSRHVAVKLQGVVNSSAKGNTIYGLATATDTYDARLGGIYLLGGNNYTYIDGNNIYTDDTAAIAIAASDPLCFVGENPYTTTAASPIGSAISANMKRYVDYTAKTASDTGGGITEDLNSRVIAQNSMPVKTSIRFEAAGTKAGTSGNKSIALVWGTQTYTVHAAANNTNDWRIVGTIVFSATNVQQISWTCWDGATVTQGYEAATEDSAAGDITLKLTGTTAAANDSIVQRLWIVEKSF